MAARRVLGIAMDFSPASKYALEWALQNVVRHKDQLVVLVVLNKTEENAHHDQLWGGEGSPLIPLVEFKEAELLKKYGIKQDIEVLDKLETISRQMDDLVIVGKVYWGDAREKLHQAVSQLKLDCLFMGSRGLGTIKGALLGSVSSYLVTYAVCPVVVLKLPPTQ